MRWLRKIGAFLRDLVSVTAMEDPAWNHEGTLLQKLDAPQPHVTGRIERYGSGCEVMILEEPRYRLFRYMPTGNVELDPVTGAEIPKHSER